LREPTYVLAFNYPHSFEEAEEVSLGNYILLLWRRRILILGGTVLCTLAAFPIS